MNSTNVATDATPMAVAVVVEDLQPATDDEVDNNNNNEPNKRSKKCKLVLYWVIFVHTIAVVVFLSGAIFSCRAFDNEDFVYGYRGFINNETNDCTSWKEHYGYNEGWYGFFQTRFHMGIAAVVLSVMALAVWIMVGRIVRATTVSSLRRTFAVVIGATGILSFIVLVGNCDNIPPLGEGGPDCHLTVWTALGFFASLSACVTASVPFLTPVRTNVREVPNLEVE